MAYGRDTLVDPSGAVGAYVFDIGHDEEDEFGSTTAIERTANTAGTGLVMQAGEPSIDPIRITGKAMKLSQYQKLVAFERQSKLNTLIWTDFFGDSYEVVISSFKAKRVRTLFNRRDPANMRYHIYQYTLEMTVVTVRAGAWT